MRKSIYDLLAQNTASFPDNTAGAITPAILRTMIKDFLDTMQPAYGMIKRLAPLAYPVTAVPARFEPFDTTVIVSAPDFSANLATGTVNALMNGLAQKVVRGTLMGTIEGPVGAEVTVELYAGGNATGFQASVECNGAGKLVSFNITGIGNPTLDTSYNLFVYGDVRTFTFSNVWMTVENVPVIGP